MSASIYASFATADMAEQAIGALLDHGVRGEDIGVVFHEDYSHVQTSDTSEESREIRNTAEQGLTTTTPQDAASGAAKGAGIGLGVGVLAGLATLIVPGFGIVLGGGALAAALGAAVGTTAAGAVAGGAYGYLRDQGVEEATIHRYSTVLSGGGAIVSVVVPSNDVDGATIEGVLAKYGGADVARNRPADVSNMAVVQDPTMVPTNTGVNPMVDPV
jgi:hypothetical protein